jgi:hypothetical protein
MKTTSETGSGIPGQAAAPAPANERCGQCGAPAAPEQRYCVNCGFHRRNAPDPVARYLSEASAARARVAAAAALAAQRRHPTRLGLRTVALLVAMALLVGTVIGGAFAGGSAVPMPGSSGPSPRNQAGSGHPAKPAGSANLRNATGSSYLQQERNLPTSVTP